MPTKSVVAQALLHRYRTPSLSRSLSHLFFRSSCCWAQFPFLARGFHSDGGSEYVNHEVASVLDQLRIEFTRSASRHTNATTGSR